MRFGALFAPRASDWRLACDVEGLGYDSAWIADSQMLWSDCYAILALAAANTSRIRLGTGVTNAGTRLAPVTASAIATINQLAPGRTFLAIATGSSSLQTMGAKPTKIAEFREYLRVVRALLHGQEVDYHLSGTSGRTAFFDTDLGFINIDSPPPIYVAANGPKALEIAGAYGDGCISAGDREGEKGEKLLGERQACIARGAERAGRNHGEDFQSILSTFVCLLRPGETLHSERVIDEIGALTVVGTLHAWWELSRKDPTCAFVPPACRDVFERYLAHLASLGIPPEKLHLRVHKGHGTYLLPEEREFVTPEIIRAGGGLVGKPDELIEHLRTREKAGLDEFVIMPALRNARADFAEFSKEVIARY